MTKQRDINLEKYSISPARYRELLYFCRQYPEWQEILRHDTDTVKALPLSKMPGAPIRKISDQTGDLAARRAELSKKCELVEQTAIQADSEIYEYIIRNVTQEGAGYEYFRRIADLRGEAMYFSKGRFYGARRRFFWLLDKNKTGV